MAVTPGTKALTTDYDSLAGSVDGWFSDGCPGCSFGSVLQTYGWGGPIIPARGSSMTAAQMNSLVDRCNIAGDIIESFAVNIPQIVAGSPSAASQYNQLQNASALIAPLRNNIDPAELSVHGGTSDSRTTLWGTSDTTSINSIIRWTWSDFNKSRYFWNSGGALNRIMSLVGGTTPNAANFVTLFSTMGTVTMDKNSTVQSGTGGNPSSIGYYDLTTGFQQIFEQNIGGYGYTYGAGQSIRIYARRSASGNYVELETLCTDGDSGNVDGTLYCAGQNRSLDSQTSGAVTLTVTTPTSTIIETFE